MMSLFTTNKAEESDGVASASSSADLSGGAVSADAKSLKVSFWTEEVAKEVVAGKKVIKFDDFKVPEDAKWVATQVGDTMQRLVMSNLSSLYGTTIASVMTAFLESLSIARLTQKPGNLLADMILAVFVSQGVSRKWASVYDSISAGSMFKIFEIDGRIATDTSGQRKDAWVSSSKMNSTAVGILGHAIVANAPIGSSLHAKAVTDGTMFNPPADAKAALGEYGTITEEARKKVSENEMAMVGKATAEAAVLIRVVASIFQAGGGNINSAIAMAQKIGVRRF